MLYTCIILNVNVVEKQFFNLGFYDFPSLLLFHSMYYVL